MIPRQLNITVEVSVVQVDVALLIAAHERRQFNESTPGWTILHIDHLLEVHIHWLWARLQLSLILVLFIV